MTNLLRHLFGYLPVNLVQGLVGFGSVFVFTRLLGADDYGRYALALSTMFLLHTFVLTWVEAAAYRFAGEAEAKGDVADHYRTSLALGALALVPALLIAGLAWIFSTNDPQFRAILPWIALNLPVSLIVNMALQSHKAGQRVARYSMVEIGHVLGGFLTGILLAWLGGLGAASPIAGLTLATVVLALIEGRWLWIRGRAGKLRLERARMFAAYGLPIGAALVLDLLLSSSDRFLIAWFLDPAAVGAYAAGYGVADKTILMLCAWAALAGSPLTMAAYETGGAEAAGKQARGLIQMFILLALPATVGLALVARPLAEVMIGEALRDQAVHIIPWIAVAGLLNGLLIHYFSEAFQLTRKTLERALLMIAPTILNIALNLVLIPAFGLMGAVYATVISYGGAVVLLALAGRRHLKLPLAIGDLVRAGFACLAMAGAVSLIPAWGGLVELVTKAATGGAVFAMVALALDAAGARTFLTRHLAGLRALKNMAANAQGN